MAGWFYLVLWLMSVLSALASSAPVWLFGDLVPCGRFNQIVTRTFSSSSFNCVMNIRKSWNVISLMAQTGCCYDFFFKVKKIFVEKLPSSNRCVIDSLIWESYFLLQAVSLASFCVIEQ
jgi:hypothetical protein